MVICKVGGETVIHQHQGGGEMVIWLRMRRPFINIRVEVRWLCIWYLVGSEMVIYQNQGRGETVIS